MSNEAKILCLCFFLMFFGIIWGMTVQRAIAAIKRKRRIKRLHEGANLLPSSSDTVTTGGREMAKRWSQLYADIYVDRGIDE